MRGFDSIEDVEDLAVVDIEGERFDVASGRLRLRPAKPEHKHQPRPGGGRSLRGVGDGGAQRRRSRRRNNLTPDQNVVEDFGAAMGLTYEDDEELACGVKSRERDRHRWELDPASADDWDDRKRS